MITRLQIAEAMCNTRKDNWDAPVIREMYGQLADVAIRLLLPKCCDECTGFVALGEGYFCKKAEKIYWSKAILPDWCPIWR